MIKYAFSAAVAVLALGMPAVVQAQTTTPPPLMAPQPGMTTNANTTIIGQPQPGPDEYYDQGYAAPMPSGPPVYVQPVSPRTTWIPAHYDWDPTTSNYAWIDGHYTEAPHENAQWIPGHWAQTPNAWIWVDGRWN
jgi:hypothetical protein